jgi:hypothetical protein
VTDRNDGRQEDEGFGVEKLDIASVGENGNAEYRSGKAFGVGTPEVSRGLEPKYKDPISVNRWEKIAMTIAARFLSNLVKLL